MEIFNILLEKINILSKESPVVAGIVSLYGMGIVTYLLKDIPSRIIRFARKQGTVTMSFSNYDELYYFFLRWYNEQGYDKKSRTLRLTERGSENILSAGYGPHYFWYRGRPYCMTRTKEEANNTTAVKESISISTIGRTQVSFRTIKEEIDKLQDEHNNDGRMTVWKWGMGSWYRLCKQSPRKLDTVILPNETKEKLLTNVTNFYDREEWYLDKGIPYRMGILLEGPPGTGKTSIVKALCSHFKKDLHILTIPGLNDDTIQNAFTRVPKNSVILIEDIDAQHLPDKRGALEGKKTNDSEKKNSIEPLSEGETTNTEKLTLSGLLNAIDGVFDSEGRILIMTTNDKSKLDKALMRRGRVDLELHIGNVQKECIDKFFTRFYTDFSVPKDIELRKDISPAYLQGLMLENLEQPDKVLKELVG